MDLFLILMVIILILAVILLFIVINCIIPAESDRYERERSENIEKIKEQYI